MDAIIHGFVDYNSIPVPRGGHMSLGGIEADHKLSTRVYRDILAGRARERGDMEAAADFMTNGGIEVPRFLPEIQDFIRGRGQLGQRISARPATGQPSRYFEQRAIVSGGFKDPRLLAPTAGSPTRSERYITLKAIAAQTNFGLFDIEVNRLQGQMGGLLAKDIADMVKGTLRTSDKALWHGTDTDMAVPTTLEYVGGLTQINRTFSVASTASAIDAIKREVASIMGNQDFEAMPTAIYMQPEGLAVLEEEERLNQRQEKSIVVAGQTITGIQTAAGVLPIISDWTLGSPVASISEAGKQDFTCVILTESLVEYHYLTAAEPRLYLLGLQNNLASQYVCVMFGAPVFRGKADTVTPEINPITYAHSVGTITK